MSVEYLLTGEEVALPDDDYLKEDDSYIQKGYPMYKRSIPRQLDADIIEAIMYCSDDQIQGIRNILGIGSTIFSKNRRMPDFRFSDISVLIDIDNLED